jgi:rhodanese-related sulfurtransferase
MNRNVVFAIAALAVVALLAFAVLRSSPQQATAASPSATAPATDSAPPAEVPFIEQAEAKQLVDQNRATLLDIRDAESYVISHIPGALQIPLSRVQGEVPFLPKDKTIVAYCTCPHDEAAIEAVQILQHAGMQNGRVLRGGLQAWQQLGFPTASGMK